MSYLNLQDKIRIRCGRYKVGSPTLNSQPGAHTGSTRKYIPGYSDSNIIYRAPTTGNDANDGLTEGTPKKTKSACDTAAGSTKKIRIIEACALNESVSKPTEMKRGVNGSISSSLTDPVASLTSSGVHGWTSGQPRRVVWVPKYSKFYGVGSTEIVSSPDGDTWTLEETITGALGYRIFYSEYHQRIYVLCTAGKLLYSNDGITFTELAIGSDTLGAIAYSKDSGKYALGSLSKIYNSADGIEWESVNIDTDNIITSGVYAAGKFVFFNGNGELFYSTTGIGWAKSSPLDSYEVNALTYMENAALFIAADVDGGIWSSPDGTTWTNRRSALVAPSFDAIYIKETGVCVISDYGRFLSRSTDGISWTTTSALAAYASGDQIRGLAYSPLLGRIATVGGNDGGSTRVNARGPAYANTISASIAGFTVQAMQYSGTVTAYNCTFKQPGTTAILATDSCRITESGAHISSNIQAHFATLAEGDFRITGVPASQNAIAVNCCTVAGKVYDYNSSATSYEQLRDNIIEGGFYANYATPMLSGNLRGGNTNGLLSKSVRYDDPGFVDTVDYKLKRKTQGDNIDSPLVAAASYYVNEQGEQRDIGAWSLDDSALPYDYRETFFITKPAGQGLKPKKVPMASAEQGIDGQWDSTNEPARASEYLTFQCASVPIEDLQAQDYIESKTDLTCEVCLDPQELSPTTPIVVNGAHSIGDVVLNIDGSTTIKSGMILPIGGKNYFVMYTIGGATATKLVLNEPLKSSVSDNAEIIPNEPVGYGTYQYVPQQRETPRPHSQEKDIVLSVVWSFVRQYPQL